MILSYSVAQLSIINDQLTITLKNKIMPKDTVTLSLEEYNRLRDFEKAILNKKILGITTYHGKINRKFYGENSILKEIKKHIKQMEITHLEKVDTIGFNYKKIIDSMTPKKQKEPIKQSLFNLFMNWLIH